MNPIESIQVNPSVYSQTISSVDIVSIVFASSSSLNINVNMRDSSQTFIKNQNLTMSGTDFDNWQNSNDYLVNWVLTQLNLTKSS